MAQIKTGKSGGKKKHLWVSGIMLITCLSAAVYFAYPVIRERIEQWQNEEAADMHNTGDDEIDRYSPEYAQAQITPSPFVSPDVLSPLFISPPMDTVSEPEGDDEAYMSSDIITEDEIEALLAAETPVDFPELKEISEMQADYSNDDIVGYIIIPGTNIYYPVVQAEDNDFYLRRTIYKEDNATGTIFMDYENSVDEFSDNTVIYGHNMRNGSMFHNMRYYQDERYFKKHRFIYFKTPNEETVWEIFAFYKTSPDFYYIQTSFKDETQFMGLALQMKLKSMYDTGVIVGMNDKILTLSTCSSDEGNNRYVLNARLVTD